MEELSAKQRYLKMFQGEKVDRIPICPRVHNNVIYEFFGKKNFNGSFLEHVLEYNREFDFDIIDWNCTPVPHFSLQEFVIEGPGWHPVIETKKNGETSQEIITIQTPKGQLRRVQSTTIISEWEVESALVEYPVKSEKDFDIIEEFMPEPYKLDISSISKAKELIGEEGIISPSIHGCFNTLGYCYRTLENLLIDVSLNPKFHHRMMNYFADRICNYLQQMMDAGIHMVDVGCNMANGIVVSPEWLVEYFLPYENRIADFIQDRGVIAMYHNCGHAANHLDVYDQLHFKAWGYVTPPPHGDSVLEEVIRKVPRNMILWGHIDQIDFLRQATPEQIDERVKYICDTIKPRGGFILGTTDYIEINTPPENLKALVEAGRKYGRYDD